MRFKRLLAGVMAFVFSLNMSHINVNAEEKSGKIIGEKEKTAIVLKKEDITKDESIDESTAKKVLMKAANITKKVVSFGSDLGLSVIKKIPIIIISLIKYMAVGWCIVCGGVLCWVFVGERMVEKHASKKNTKNFSKQRDGYRPLNFENFKK